MKYTGREIEAMDFAVNYHRWILDGFRPWLGKRIVEVGAGSGAFSELLMGTKPEALTMLEPSGNLYPLLAERMRRGQPLNVTLREAAKFIATPDSIIYVNVLEHIEDDEDELAAVHSLLSNGGRVFIFVPANSWLMSDMDRLMGHYRRYTRDELIRKCRSAGFQIRSAKYFDFPGIFPWLLKYRLMKSTSMESGLVKLYDGVVVPVIRMMEDLISPPMGKSILLIGEKE
jgi:2-polyprenyl-3-methyl-5-hydroxy-6-metoxy-1,4-benzoquinol methylase